MVLELNWIWWLTVWFGDWVWLVDWLNNWFIIWLSDLPFDWLIAVYLSGGWFLYIWSIDFWLLDWLFDCFMKCLLEWLSNGLTYQFFWVIGCLGDCSNAKWINSFKFCWVVDSFDSLIDITVHLPESQSVLAFHDHGMQGRSLRTNEVCHLSSSYLFGQKR